MGSDRQAKLKRLARGAAFGKTRPQGVGVKTQAGSAGDVRGRVSTDRPPAIVRTADSFKKTAKPVSQTRGVAVNKNPLSASEKAAVESAMQQRQGLRGQTSPLQGKGSTMPQTGDLFSQPASAAKKTGSRTVGGLTSEPTGKFDPKKQRTAGTRSASGQRLVKTPKAANPNTLKLNTQPGKAPGARVQAPVNRPGVPSQFNQMPKPGGGPTSPGRTNVGAAVNQSRMPSQFSQMPRAGGGPTAPGRTNVGAVQASGTRAPGIAVNRKPLSPEEMAKIARAQKAGGKPGATFRPVESRTRGGAIKGKTPAELKAIEDALRARRAGGTTPPVTNKPNTMPPQFNQMPKPGGGPSSQVISRVTQSIPKPAPKPSFLGKVGNMVKGSGPMMAAGHLLEDAYSGVQSAAKGDWKGAGQRAMDLLGHGPMGPAGFVAQDIATVASGQKIARGVPTSIGDRIVHGKIFPNRYYSDSNEARAEARGKQPATAPATSGGNKPGGGTSQKPSGPAYFPEAGRNGSAVRTPDSYLGEAFDYSLQKGTNSGTKYLEHMFRRDKISEDDQQRLRERFNKKVVGDQTLQEYGANQGITKTLEGKKAGLGEALLGKYRDTGTYKGNTDYDVMRAAAEARMARK
jgi:hypothetical protein